MFCSDRDQLLAGSARSKHAGPARPETIVHLTQSCRKWWVRVNSREKPQGDERAERTKAKTMVSGFEFVLVGLAAVAAGVVNALAGGGTLITFPMLIAVGVPAIAANVTNTVALCPGYLGATLAQLNDLRGQKRRMWLALPAGVIGGVIGGILLLNTGERVFRALVPFLILLASGLLAVQDPVRAWIVRRSGQAGSTAASEKLALLPLGLAAIYGGYFGAGVSVI